MGDSLSIFKDLYKGRAGFIMSCGPTINQVDFSKLENEIIIGTSLAYKSGANLTYSMMGDRQIASQFWTEMYHLPITLLVSKTIKDTYFFDRPDTYAFEGSYGRKFCTDISNGRMYGGGTSTFLAMQFAYWLGMNPVYCIGLDHYKTYQDGLKNINITGRKNLSGQPLVTATGKDPHHFTGDFYKKGTNYFLPTIDKMEASYHLARMAYHADGREIYNLSPDTALSEDVIPRMEFDDAISRLSR